MYGLSTQTDLSPMVGRTLTFVGFGEYQLQLAFSGDQCSISVEGDYSVAPRGRDSMTYSKAVDGAQVLLPLLGHDVATACVPTDGIVRLVFDDYSMVEVLDSSPNYESYQLAVDGQLLVI